MNWKKVSKEEFNIFLANYPNKLEKDVAYFFEPPMLSYNDFSDGKKWPESMVAQVCCNTFMERHPNYKEEPDEYYLPE
jgi:hypothetical protein